jgi:hypothetical protein
MRDDLLKYLSKRIQEEKAVLEQDIAIGNAKDFGAYQYACGIYRGLLVANNFIIELSERLDKDNE